MTLRLRLSLAFLLVVIVPLVVAAIVVGRGVPHALDTAAENRLAASRAGAVALVQEVCTEARMTAEVLGREAVSTSASRATADVVGRGLAAYAVVTSKNGTITGRAGSLPVGGQLRPQDLGSCSRRQAPVTSVAAIADSVDIRSTTGATLGQAAVAVPLDRSAVSRIAAASNAEVTLLAGRRVIASTLPSAAAAQVARVAAAHPASTDSRHAGSRLITVASVGEGQAEMVLSVDRPQVNGLEALVVAVLIAALILSALIGWLLARVTTRPLADLSEAAARVAGGDLDTRIVVRSRDEVGQLATAFNEMTDELRSYINELETNRDELRRNLARLGDTLSGTHDLGRILTVILDTAIASTRASAGAVYVTQPSREELQLKASRGLAVETASSTSRIRLGDGVTGRVASTGEAVRGRVGSEGLELSPSEPTATELISVPLRASEGIIGVLNLYDRSDDKPFDDRDLETIRTFAGQASVALDNVLLHQEAQRLSVTDGLTGLGNYRFFQSTLAREVERASRFHRSLAVCMLDLDLFKQVNDAHGHQVGDAVMVEVADRIRDEIREVDVVARYGGEEFVVVLPETGREGAGYTAERICNAIRRRPIVVGGLQLRITVSAGVAVFPMHGDTPASIVRAADEALYAAKAGGRDRWRMAPDPVVAQPR
ncbi:MAG TPA: diguanylate cyclase [Mycobacteriales bacterium]|nr:diguanylate cyclase [Mycobacteriales bacterium]